MVLFADGQLTVPVAVGADDVPLPADAVTDVLVGLVMLLGPVYMDKPLVPDPLLVGTVEVMDGELDLDVVEAPIATEMDDSDVMLALGMVDVLGHAVSEETIEVMPPCI